MWQTVKSLTNVQKQNPPRFISFNNKKIQCSKSYCPWINNNFKIQASIHDNLHSIANSVARPIAWREYRNQRNLVNRLNRLNKSNYYKGVT